MKRIPEGGFNGGGGSGGGVRADSECRGEVVMEKNERLRALTTVLVVL